MADERIYSAQTKKLEEMKSTWVEIFKVGGSLRILRKTALQIKPWRNFRGFLLCNIW